MCVCVCLTGSACMCRLCHFLWTLFSGFLITRPAMAKGFVWLYYVSGTAYVLYGNAAAQLGNESRKAIIPGATPEHALLRRTMMQAVDDGPSWRSSGVAATSLDCHSHVLRDM